MKTSLNIRILNIHQANRVKVFSGLRCRCRTMLFTKKTKRYYWIHFVWEVVGMTNSANTHFELTEGEKISILDAGKTSTALMTNSTTFSARCIFCCDTNAHTHTNTPPTLAERTGNTTWIITRNACLMQTRIIYLHFYIFRDSFAVAHPHARIIWLYYVRFNCGLILLLHLERSNKNSFRLYSGCHLRCRCSEVSSSNWSEKKPKNALAAENLFQKNIRAFERGI